MIVAVPLKSPVPAPLVLLVALVIPGVSAAGPPDPGQSTVLPWDNLVSFPDAVIFSNAYYNQDFQDSCLSIPPPQAPGDTIITTQNVLNWYDQSSGMRGVYSGNLVEPLIDAPETYTDMRNAMAAASGPTDFIYMLNWWMDDTYPTDPVSRAAGTKLSSIFAAADARGVMLRAMLYSQPLQIGRINLPQVYRLMSLTNGAAILDEAHLPVGSHHQKIMLVRNGQGLTGYFGGIDWNADRL